MIITLVDRNGISKYKCEEIHSDVPADSETVFKGNPHNKVLEHGEMVKFVVKKGSPHLRSREEDGASLNRDRASPKFCRKTSEL